MLNKFCAFWKHAENPAPPMRHESDGERAQKFAPVSTRHRARVNFSVAKLHVKSHRKKTATFPPGTLPHNWRCSGSTPKQGYQCFTHPMHPQPAALFFYAEPHGKFREHSVLGRCHKNLVLRVFSEARIPVPRTQCTRSTPAAPAKLKHSLLVFKSYIPYIISILLYFVL